MADNETNSSKEGKDLPLHEAIAKMVEDAPKDEKGNILEPAIININGQVFFLYIQKDEKVNTYKIYILGIHILTLDENKQLTFTENWEEALEDMIKELKDKDTIDGKKLIEALKEKEQKNKRKDVDKEKPELDKKDEEEISKDEQVKEQVAKKQGIDKEEISGLVEIDLHRKVTRLESFSKLVPNAEKYTNIYVVPRKKYNRIYNSRINKRWEIRRIKEFKSNRRYKSYTRYSICRQRWKKHTKGTGIINIWNKRN